MFVTRARATDAARLNTVDLPILAPRLTEVIVGITDQSGAVDPEHLALRQRTGSLRGMRLNTITEAVLGTLNGDLTIGRIMTAVTQLLEAPAEGVAARAIPAVRWALAE